MFYVFYPFLYINVYLHKKATLQLYVTVSAAFGQVKSKSYLLFLCHVFLLTFIMFLLFILQDESFQEANFFSLYSIYTG